MGLVPWTKKVRTAIAVTSLVVMAAQELVHAQAMRVMIERAFSPVIELLQGVAFPIAFLMISGGFIALTLGQRSRGIEMMKWAIIGYLGLQLAPALMRIIVEVGEAMRIEQAMP